MWDIMQAVLVKPISMSQSNLLLCIVGFKLTFIVCSLDGEQVVNNLFSLLTNRMNHFHMKTEKLMLTEKSGLKF